MFFYIVFVIILVFEISANPCTKGIDIVWHRNKYYLCKKTHDPKANVASYLNDNELRHIISQSADKGYKALFEQYYRYVYAIVFRILQDILLLYLIFFLSFPILIDITYIISGIVFC